MHVFFIQACCFRGVVSNKKNPENRGIVPRTGIEQYSESLIRIEFYWINDNKSNNTVTNDEECLRFKFKYSGFNFYILGFDLLSFLTIGSNSFNRINRSYFCSWVQYISENPVARFAFMTTLYLPDDMNTVGHYHKRVNCRFHSKIVTVKKPW